MQRNIACPRIFFSPAVLSLNKHHLLMLNLLFYNAHCAQHEQWTLCMYGSIPDNRAFLDKSLLRKVGEDNAIKSLIVVRTSSRHTCYVCLRVCQQENQNMLHRNLRIWREILMMMMHDGVKLNKRVSLADSSIQNIKSNDIEMTGQTILQ